MKLPYLQQGFGSGLPLVLLHPYPLNSRFWSSQLSALSKTRHVIAPNFRGYGAARTNSQDEFTVAGFASDVRKTLRTAQVNKAVFGGCSLGGYVLFEIWRQDPDLVAGMALIGTKAEPDDDETRTKRKQVIEKVRAVGTADIPQTAENLLAECTRQNKPAVMRDVRAWAEEPSCETIIKTLEMMLNRPDSRPTLATINVPTMIIVGENDTIAPPEIAMQMSDHIKHAYYEVIPDAGHLAPVENPTAVNAALNSLLQDPAIS